jgi:hypothetical protein
MLYTACRFTELSRCDPFNSMEVEGWKEYRIQVLVKTRTHSDYLRLHAVESVPVCPVAAIRELLSRLPSDSHSFWMHEGGEVLTYNEIRLCVKEVLLEMGRGAFSPYSIKAASLSFLH